MWIIQRFLFIVSDLHFIIFFIYADFSFSIQIEMFI